MECTRRSDTSSNLARAIDYLGSFIATRVAHDRTVLPEARAVAQFMLHTKGMSLELCTRLFSYAGADRLFAKLLDCGASRFLDATPNSFGIDIVAKLTAGRMQQSLDVKHYRRKGQTNASAAAAAGGEKRGGEFTSDSGSNINNESEEDKERARQRRQREKGKNGQSRDSVNNKATIDNAAADDIPTTANNNDNNITASSAVANQHRNSGGSDKQTRQMTMNNADENENERVAAAKRIKVNDSSHCVNATVCESSNDLRSSINVNNNEKNAAAICTENNKRIFTTDEKKYILRAHRRMKRRRNTVVAQGRHRKQRINIDSGKGSDDDNGGDDEGSDGGGGNENERYYYGGSTLPRERIRPALKFGLLHTNKEYVWLRFHTFSRDVRMPVVTSFKTSFVELTHRFETRVFRVCENVYEVYTHHNVNSVEFVVDAIIRYIDSIGSVIFCSELRLFQNSAPTFLSNYIKFCYCYAMNRDVFDPRDFEEIDAMATYQTNGLMFLRTNNLTIMPEETHGPLIVYTGERPKSMLGKFDPAKMYVNEGSRAMLSMDMSSDLGSTSNFVEIVGEIEIPDSILDSKI